MTPREIDDVLAAAIRDRAEIVVSTDAAVYYGTPIGTGPDFVVLLPRGFERLRGPARPTERVSTRHIESVRRTA